MQRDWRRKVYSASRLDEFLAYFSGERWDGEEYTTEEFIERLTKFTPSPAMEAGTAVHALIETSGFGALPVENKSDGWSVVFDCDAVVELPEQREIELFRSHKGIPLFGRCDAIDAITVHDLKTTSSIDPDRYLESYQWRAYLWMSGRTEFVYDIFRVIVSEEKREVTVKEYVPIKISAYPKMSADVEELLERVHECVSSLNLEARLTATGAG